MVAEFEKQNPDIKVETEVIGYDDYFTKLQTQASSKTLPDVFEMNYENFNTCLLYTSPSPRDTR